MTSQYWEAVVSGPAASLVACVWEQRVSHRHSQLVVPDGCLDLIWFGDGELVVAGGDTGPRLVDLPANTEVAGVRLRPGAAGAVLGWHAAELRDRRVDAADLWGQEALRLAETLAVVPTDCRGRHMLKAVTSRGATPDPLVQAAALHLARPHARVAAAAAELGVSERQLHRRTVAAVGYGPKMLARVGRLRRFMHLRAPDLAGRALLAGYASQAHMNDEVRRLTGMTPVRFLEALGGTSA
ncbi:helix-turn-helix domain-containing protein [Micromonospora sp. KC723]|uniref:helix-turn-helix domain-containing protein n=1 Tax=Micromonospora sp. KC723 TaxID=2530381 RepID=UPI0010515FB6|nr:helix-turn-helix domain-containing protein [Micromonospora sp. KC723]TDB73232.1 AraC family transcriptional regulator [Micromonospora sp. KC723]